jgi:hypothetical protein
VRFLTLFRGGWALGGGGNDFLIWLGPVDARHLPAVADPFATFSIFFWFQITNFDLFLGFFSLCHFTFPFLFWGCPDDDARHLLATTGKDYIW